jgi:disulfide bond formation protein DsbB
MNKKSDRLKTFMQDYGAHLAFAVALTAMLGSLYFSEIARFIPCTLCWYQRILMYPLTIIILVGIIERDEFLPKYVMPLSIVGMGASSYHYLLQLGVFGHSSGCTIGVPCNSRYVNYFGFITIPFMALTAFTLITLVMSVMKWAHTQPDTVLD